MIYPQSSQSSTWESKIVRARHGEFAQPGYLDALLREESVAGWRLAEVYDDSLVRLVRPMTARSRDAFLPRGVNPYRTVYAAPEPGANAGQALFLTVCVLLVLGSLILIALVAVWHIGP